MKLSKIYEILDQICPFSLQEEWDNSGLQLGNLQFEIEKIYISLDLDLNSIKQMDENSLIITHHPLIFKGLKKMNLSFYPANLISQLIQKNISLISMHTNFDKKFLNKFFVEKILGFEILKEDEFLIYVKNRQNFDDFAQNLKEKLQISHINVVKSKNFVENIAICCGSGADLISNLKNVDTFLTGDIKYHTAFEAKQNGLNLMDITHFVSEICFCDCLKLILQKNKIQAIITNSINPFSII